MRSFILGIFIFLSFVGCSSKYNIVQNPTIKNDANNSTIVFYRKNTFYGGGLDLYLFEVINEKLTPVTILQTNQKIIYNVTPGIHRFYTSATFENIIEIDVQKNKTYNVDLFLSSNFRLFPIVKENYLYRDKALNDIKTYGCKEDLLNKYDFYSSNKKDYFSSLLVNIDCEDKKLLDIDDMLKPISKEDIQNIPTIELNQDGKKLINSKVVEFQNKYNIFYPYWKQKIKDTVIGDKPFLYVEKLIDDKYYKKFDGAIFTIKNPTPKDKEMIALINETTQDLKAADNINVEINFNKNFDDGSFLQRKFTMDYASSNNYSLISVIEVELKYFYKDELLSVVRFTISADSLNEINFAKVGIAQRIKSYTQNNFLK